MPLGHEGSDGERFSESEALFSINEDGIGLNLEVMFEARADLEELLMSCFGLCQFPLKLLQSLVHFVDLGNKTELRFVATKFDVRAVSTTLKTGLSNLKGWCFVFNGLAHEVHVLLHVEDFLLHL